MRPHWPAVAIGLIVGFYWARVLRLVFKTRATVGRAANFLPPEPLGRALRILWYPLVAGWVACPFLTGLLRHPPPPLRPLFNVTIIAVLAVIVALAALAGTLVCWKRMGRSWRMGIDPGEKTQLIFTGPYAFVRHPIYALSSLLMIASFFAVPTPAMIVIAIGHLFFLQWEARREERYLVQLHGDQYVNYMRHVGRFVPLSPSPYRGGVTAD